MGRTLCMPLLGIGIIAATGCSSTLNEFRCTENVECVENQVDGICHSSGYCAFPDSVDCTGLRFGKLSGEQSGQCVGDPGDGDAGLADASNLDAGQLPDADPDDLRPTAAVDPISLECGATIVNLDGRDSEAKGEATLETFTWTLRTPSSEVIATLSGDPSDDFRASATFLSGSINDLDANITPYQSASALFVDTDEAYTEIIQSNLNLSPGNYRLTFAVGSALGENVSADFGFVVGVNPASIFGQGQTNLTYDMQSHTLDFSVPTFAVNAVVVFYTASGEFWLDNVVLKKNTSTSSSSSALLTNPSFESGTIGWEADFDNPTAEMSAEHLPMHLVQYGAYTAELVVTDSDGLSSLPNVININHQPCP